MPWRASRRSRRSEPGGRVAAGTGRQTGSAALILALLVAGCAGTVVSRLSPEEEAVQRERPFLLPPLTGYALSVAPGREAAVDEAFAALVEVRQPAAARRLAVALLERTPELHPAVVVVAQADLVDGRFEAALAAVEPILEELPDYTAARLLQARAAEGMGDLPLAFASYRQVAGQVGAARDRLDVLGPRAIEIVEKRLEDALRRGRLDEAAADLVRLRDWAPGEEPTWRSERRLAAATGDAAAELAAVRQLLRLRPGDRELEIRQADLELEVGDAGRGLRILQELAAADPTDRLLAERLARARFLWRLQLLPPEANRLTRLPELTRGDFAALLFWLFPTVRYGRVEGGTIANDVFDHPAREEIVRVVNLGLMTVDPTLHRFDPERRLTRAEALRGVLSVLDGQRPRLACLGGGPRPVSGVSIAGLCRMASGCELIGDEAECLPEAPMGGSEAVEIARKALEQLGLG